MNINWSGFLLAEDGSTSSSIVLMLRVKSFFFSLTFKISTSVLQVTNVTAVRHVTIQLDHTHAPVTVATREMDEPAMVNELQSNPANTDTEGGIESVRIKWVGI